MNAGKHMKVYRYKYTDKTLSLEEAIKRKQCRIIQQIDKINSIQQELMNAFKCLSELKEQKLEKTIRVEEKLHPSDPGFNEAYITRF